MIFLIKIKLGISYSAIDVLFNVNRITVFRIFFIVLNYLVSNKNTILEPLQRASKRNDPNYRCIIEHRNKN